jgi:DNA-binding transcriptional regulator YdaS (Cro superfamily)
MKLRQYLTHATIPEFAARIGETERSVKNWFYGNRRPSIDAILKIEKATDGEVKPADWASQDQAA